MHHPDELYALWLQLACGICNTVYLKLFTRFSSCREIYDCRDYSFLAGKHRCEKSLREKDLSAAYELQKRLRALGYLNSKTVQNHDQRQRAAGICIYSRQQR